MLKLPPNNFLKKEGALELPQMPPVKRQNDLCTQHTTTLGWGPI